MRERELLELFIALPPQERERVFYTTAMASRLTGLSRRTIELWIETGAVRAVHVGKKYQIEVRSLEEHLARRSDRDL
jgi:excisionase family DNA binding protein